jgi:hypothetical protein
MTKYSCELSKAYDQDLDEYDPEKDEDLDEPEMPEIVEDSDESKEAEDKK